MKKEVKQRVLRLLDLGMTLNEQEDYDVFIDYHGHVNQIEVNIAIGGTLKWVFNKSTYLKGGLFTSIIFNNFCDKAEKQIIKLTD
tara:strand:- start:386 stop:640 length:255 start_codon:yes stop_codon:yes gene_type:complete